MYVRVILYNYHAHGNYYCHARIHLMALEGRAKQSDKRIMLWVSKQHRFLAETTGVTWKCHDVGAGDGIAG